MKKIILGLLSVFAVLTFAGCGAKEDIKLDLEKISSELDSLTENKVDFSFIYFEDMPGYETELDFVYNLPGLDNELVLESKIYYTEGGNELFAVINPMEGKMADVKSQMNTFVGTINGECQEINGLLVCAASGDNAAVFKKVKETKVQLFGMMDQINDETLETLNIKVEDVEEYLIKQAVMGSAVRYIIVKPAEGKEEVVKNALEEQMKNLETTYEFYGVGQYELVKNRKVEKIGDYLIYLVTTNNDLVFETIKSNKIVSE